MIKSRRNKAVLALAAAAVFAATSGAAVLLANKLEADAAIDAIDSTTVGSLGELENNYQNLVMPVSRITKKVASSTQSGANYSIDKMFDGNLGTKWEAVWNNPPAEKTFTFTFAQAETITGFYEVTRQDNNLNGTMSWFKVETSENGTDGWTEAVPKTDACGHLYQRQLYRHSHLYDDEFRIERTQHRRARQQPRDGGHHLCVDGGGVQRVSHAGILCGALALV